MILRFTVLLLILFSYNVHSATFDVLYEGYTNTGMGDKVLVSESDFKRFIEEYGIEDQFDGISPDENSVLKVISTDDRYFPEQIGISKVQKEENGDYIIYYRLIHPHTVKERSPANDLRPFVMVKVKGEGVRTADVISVNEALKDVVIVDNSISQEVRYSNILKNQKNYLFLDYFPLDKGNTWTYKMRRGEITDTRKFEITSFADGWSVFDNFFGKYRLGMKIDQEGELLVSSKNGIRKFYTDDVLVHELDDTFEVEAGKFKRILVVKNPDKSSFNFKDVYARDVGLIYHRHETPSGEIEYSLKSATVRGNNIP